MEFIKNIFIDIWNLAKEYSLAIIALCMIVILLLNVVTSLIIFFRQLRSNRNLPYDKTMEERFIANLNKEQTSPAEGSDSENLTF